MSEAMDTARKILADHEGYDDTNNAITIGQLRAVMAEHDALMATLRGIMEGFDAGVWVRNVTDDVNPGWALRIMRHVSALADAARAVEAGK